MSKDIFVTSPLIPPLEEFIPFLKDIWDRKWITNMGYYHDELEKSLCSFLGVEYISLFSNGTLALITALQALKISGEVITTPFSFVASTHSLWWNGIKPVFVDIEPKTFNLNPEKIESAITPQTQAIMPVHVYGFPCRTEQIQEIAKNHGLKVIYDAAHAFRVEKDGISVLNFGDLSVLSFHATKVYSTIEGGAIICHDAKMKEYIDDLKNFGFRDEITIVEPGINAKMNEVQAAFGLLSIKHVDEAIQKRRIIDQRYRTNLSSMRGIEISDQYKNIRYNFSYFPVMIDPQTYGLTRDSLYDLLKTHGIYTRRYFYPLISNLKPYNTLPSASPENLQEANRVSDSVLCLPIHPDLDIDDVDRICAIINGKS